MIFKNLKRNVNGSIDGDLIKEDESVIRYTLDPAIGHIAKAEAGEWGDIEELDPAEKTAYEAKQAQDTINQEAIKYLNDTDKFFTRLSETGKAMPEGMVEARSAARERIVI
tara:strand:+ start:574 stop:906 length:333 start_codon:yes stop_codon:yes gene_type:complete